MALTDRLAAWWSAWRWVLLLAVLLALSLYANYRQHLAALQAPLKIELASKDAALDDSAALLESARERGAALDAAASRTTILLATGASNYGKALKLRPLPPNCAPGQPRQDAVNMTLGQREAP